MFPVDEHSAWSGQPLALLSPNGGCCNPGPHTASAPSWSGNKYSQSPDRKPLHVVAARPSTPQTRDSTCGQPLVRARDGQSGVLGSTAKEGSAARSGRRLPKPECRKSNLQKRYE